MPMFMSIVQTDPQSQGAFRLPNQLSKQKISGEKPASHHKRPLVLQHTLACARHGNVRFAKFSFIRMYGYNHRDAYAFR